MRVSFFFILIWWQVGLCAQQPGELDSSFAVNGKLVLGDLTGGVEEITSLSDGRMLLMVWDGGTSRIFARHYDGSPDSTFATDGVLEWPVHVRRMLVDANDRIYLVGNANWQGVIERYLPSGDLDVLYGQGGVAEYTLADTIEFTPHILDADIYTDGRLLLSATAAGRRAFMFRLTWDGLLDETFMYGGLAIAYGYSNTQQGPWGGTCTSSKSVSCPMVKLGPEQEIYLALSSSWGHNCTPSGSHRNIDLIRFKPEILEHQQTSIFYSYNLWTAEMQVIQPNSNGLVSIVMTNSSPVPIQTSCRDEDLQPCSSPVDVFSYSLDGSPNGWLHYRRGVMNAHGNLLHVANRTIPNQASKLAIHRTTNYDLTADPVWGSHGQLFYDSLSVGMRTGMAIQGDGKILVAALQNLQGILRPVVIRLHDAGDPKARSHVRMMLAGPYDLDPGTMKDDLRYSGHVPLQDPYAMAGSIPVLSPPQYVHPDVLAITGDSAVIDWVWLEALSTDDPFLVKAAWAALLLSNGAVTAMDGSSPVDMNCGAGSYLLRVRYRNHLSVTLSEPISLGVEPVMVDLTDPATPTFGTNAQMQVDGKMMLWPGDANGDGQVKYAGMDNDRDRVLTAIGGVIPTNTTTGYLPEDINMDGVVKYTGENNDRDIILQTIGGAIPTAVRVEQGP